MSSTKLPRFDVITVFPEMVDAAFQHGVVAKARLSNPPRWLLHVWQLRDFTTDARKTVDERPYGGGPGMVMQPGPIQRAIRSIQSERSLAGYADCPVVLLTPAGTPFQQVHAEAIAPTEGMIILCGRYEGIDQRVIDTYITHQWSIGDFILSGGELAACAMIDACVRLVPGVLHDAASYLEDSFSTHHTGMLDHPHYTRPEVFEGIPVPAVLLSGDHAKIAAWRRKASLEQTLRYRPDLIAQAEAQGGLSPQDRAVLADQQYPIEK